jgi:uncharacterized protein (TIGR02597 family)
MMKTSKKFIALLSGAALLTSSAFAQTVATDPVGYITIDCLGGSDTVVSVPLSKATDGASTVAGVNVGSSAITLSLSSMTTDGYKDSHFVRFGDNSTLEGAKMTVASNTSDTLTLDVPSGYDLTDISTGDIVQIIPHTTLSELFSGVSTIPEETEVFFFNNAANGINKSSAGGYIYFAPDWYDADTFDIVNGAVLFPDDALIVRVPGTSSNDFDLVVSGAVPNVGHSFAIVTAGSGPNDNFISPQIPAEVPLTTLFSNPSDEDEILIFDNTTRAQNKSSSGGYVYFAPDWYDADTFEVVSTLAVKPWEIAVYRRSDQLGASASVSSGRAAYLNNL